MRRRTAWTVYASTLLGLFAIDAQAPQDPMPTFDVASIRVRDRNRPQLPYRIGPDLSMTARLKDLIMQAYELEDYQVEGGPAWVQTDWYDVQAKAASASTAKQIRLMTQPLLADRFKLKLHRETKIMSGYVLTVDKNGPKLPAPRTDMPLDSPGVIQIGGGAIWSRGSTMKHVATGLWLELGSPVLDQTAIEGHYDFTLRFEEGNPQLAGPDPAASAAKGNVGSIFSALHEFGLKLEARKLPIEVLVIDGVERPSEN